MPEVMFRVATEFSVVKVKVTDEGQERVDRLSAEARCLGCEETLSGKVRCGLCDTCYQGTRNAIRKKQVSRNDLIRSGHMRVPQTGGRKPKNEFTRSLQRRGRK
jgi:hypothetical protein